MSTHAPIPFGKPSLEGAELDYIRQAVEGGRTSCSGPFAQRCADLLREATGAADVLMTTSCTDALELSALLLDIQPGDTVVVPSFTFVSTALAFVRAGARLRFCDIEPRTLGLDPAHLATLMDDSVRAVIPVHYAGVAADLDGLRAVLGAWPRATLVEDNAHGLFGRYRGQPLGSFGRFATLSFHETKNFVCGEGGALLLNDPRDIERAHILYDKGTDRRAFLLGQTDKYSWRDTGSSFGLADVLAAFLFAQLEQHDRILAARQAVFDRYEELLAPLAGPLGFRTPVVPSDRQQAYHMYYVLLPDRPARDAALAALQSQGIGAAFHYVPLHSSEGGRRYADRPADCPVTDDISGRLLRLPFSNHLDEDATARIVEAFVRAVTRRPAAAGLVPAAG